MDGPFPIDAKFDVQNSATRKISVYEGRHRLNDKKQEDEIDWPTEDQDA